MPSLTVSSRAAFHTDGKGLGNVQDTLDSDSVSVPTTAGSVVQTLQSHVPSSEHYCERISGGCEGTVHTVAVHYAHAPAEDITTKFVLVPYS